MQDELSTITSQISSSFLIGIEKIHSLIKLLREKNQYSSFNYFDNDKTYLIMIAKNLTIQKQVILSIFELKSSAYFVKKEKNELLIQQHQYLNFQIDEFDLEQFVSTRSVSLKQLIQLRTFDQQSLIYVKQIEDSTINQQVNQKIHIGDFTKFEGLNKCYSLESLILNLYSSNLQNEIVDILFTSIANCYQLQVLILHLNQNNLDSNSVQINRETFKNLQQLSTLTLNLSDNQIGSAGISSIANALGQCQLQSLTLHLSENNIGQDGAIVLGNELGKLKKLINLTLNLSDNNIKSEGANHIGKGISNCVMLQNMNINLQNNKIRQIQEFCKGIMNCQQLKNLQIALRNNNINSQQQSSIGEMISALFNANINISFQRSQIDTQITNYDSQSEYTIEFQNISPSIITSFGKHLLHFQMIQSLSIKFTDCQVDKDQIEQIGLSLQQCPQLSKLMINIGSKIESEEELSLIHILKCTQISQIKIHVKNTKIEVIQQKYKGVKSSYSIKFQDVNKELVYQFSQEKNIISKFSNIQIDLRFCKVQARGITPIAEKLQKSNNLFGLKIFVSHFDVGLDGVLEFIQTIKEIKKLNTLELELYGNNIAPNKLESITNSIKRIPHLINYTINN